MEPCPQVHSVYESLILGSLTRTSTPENHTYPHRCTALRIIHGLISSSAGDHLPNISGWGCGLHTLPWQACLFAYLVLELVGSYHEKDVGRRLA